MTVPISKSMSLLFFVGLYIMCIEKVKEMSGVRQTCVLLQAETKIPISKLYDAFSRGKKIEIIGTRWYCDSIKDKVNKRYYPNL